MTTNTRNIKQFANISATTSPFTLSGGRYACQVVATFGGGSVTLKRLSNDGSTYTTCMTAFSAAGFNVADLPSGTYEFVIATATAVYIDLVSIAVPLG